MIIITIFCVIINFFAAYFTRKGDSVNQQSVNLHMLDDVLGWIVDLIGAVLMRIFDILYIDPILSIGVAAFILINAFRNFKSILNVFLEKTPHDIDIAELKEHLKEIEEVIDFHHIHVWSMDGFKNYATMHVILKDNSKEVKEKIREELEEHGISHVTIEVENQDEECGCEKCKNEINIDLHQHHHH